jgi:hypothetical protein
MECTGYSPLGCDDVSIDINISVELNTTMFSVGASDVFIPQRPFHSLQTLRWMQTIV